MRHRWKYSNGRDPYVCEWCGVGIVGFDHVFVEECPKSPRLMLPDPRGATGAEAARNIEEIVRFINKNLG